jgi:predicted DCC family thiol-disulfide oxidoreductase YuxK
MNNIQDIAKDQLVILFDGVCNLCNSSVLFVIRKDPKNRFLFAPLQGKFGTNLIRTYEIDTKKMDSIILYDPQKKQVTYKSAAALGIASYLSFPYRMATVFFIIPGFLRDLVYDFIARNRYKWFGKKEACMVPTPELKAKFLE